MITELAESANTNWTQVSASWTAVGAIAACLTVIVAAAATVLALRQLWQGRQLSEEQSRPYVIVALTASEADANIYDIVIKNIGKTAASDVSIVIDPPFEFSNPMGDEVFMNAQIFRRPVPTMPPGFGYQFLMEIIREHASTPDHPSVYTATVTYFDRRKRRQEDTFVLDLDVMKGTVVAQVHGLHHIASTLRAMSKAQGINNY